MGTQHGKFIHNVDFVIAGISEDLPELPGLSKIFIFWLILSEKEPLDGLGPIVTHFDVSTIHYRFFIRVLDMHWSLTVHPCVQINTLV